MIGPLSMHLIGTKKEKQKNKVRIRFLISFTTI